MTDSEIHRLAELIAASLFTNGSGDRADRLVLTDNDGRDLGGWSNKGAAGYIEKVIRQVIAEEHP